MPPLAKIMVRLTHCSTQRLCLLRRMRCQRRRGPINMAMELCLTLLASELQANDPAHNCVVDLLLSAHQLTSCGDQLLGGPVTCGA